MARLQRLPAGITVLERGWLSANNVVFHGQGPTAVVDTGYATHAQHTVALVRQCLAGRPLELLLNTHLHSDHCGGNSALQAGYPQSTTYIPPGQADHVRRWDPVALTYEPTGQYCPQFRFDALLAPGTAIRLGERDWQVHGAPGHDPHSVVLYEPLERLLISADALWANGFGVVFQELEGERAFDEVGATLDLIEQLGPRLVIPGHGELFTDVAGALSAARRRLAAFVEDPVRHAAHAAKVLLKFKLLELQAVKLADLKGWAGTTAYLKLMHDRWFPRPDLDYWIDSLIADLVRVGAARRESDLVLNA